MRGLFSFVFGSLFARLLARLLPGGWVAVLLASPRVRQLLMRGAGRMVSRGRTVLTERSRRGGG